MGKIKALMETMLGKANGVASLDNAGNVLHAQLGNVSRPNLLDNWYLADPIDQRNGYVLVPGTNYYSDPSLAEDKKVNTEPLANYVTAYNVVEGNGYTSFKISQSATETYYAASENVVPGYVGNEYTIDRWSISNKTALLIKNGYIHIERTLAAGNPPFIQTIDNQIPDGPVTYSILYRSNNSHVRIEVLGGTREEETKIDGARHYLPNTNGKFEVESVSIPSGKDVTQIWIQMTDKQQVGDYIDIIGVKLELGSTQTLARQDENGNLVLNDPPPDKSTELLKCQRYFYRLKSHNKNNYGVLAQGWIQSATQARSLVQFPCTMRGTPSIAASGAIQVLSGSADVLVKNILTSPHSFNGDSAVIMAEFDQCDAVTYRDFAFIGAKNDTTIYIDFDAEL